MSLGLIELRSAPIIPSTTTKGEVFSASKLLSPRMLISKPSTGRPFVFVILTPATCPCKEAAACSGFALVIVSVLIWEIAPVKSRFLLWP